MPLLNTGEITHGERLQVAAHMAVTMFCTF